MVQDRELDMLTCETSVKSARSAASIWLHCPIPDFDWPGRERAFERALGGRRRPGAERAAPSSGGAARS